MPQPVGYSAGFLVGTDSSTITISTVFGIGGIRSLSNRFRSEFLLYLLIISGIGGIGY
jgi:hypothetical protein